MRTKVAIIIPTMNRPDFMLRQFEFYELMDSPHPIYISDSSNEENATKIKEGIKKFKNFGITYQWAPPGKDYTCNLMPFVEEKYCMVVNDDDIMIPETISECADFLEANPDYATCAGKQINIHFRREDFNKPYGIIEHQTRPLGRSIEDESMSVRVKNFWSNSDLDMPIMVFTVRRVEVEKAIRNITKHFSLLEDMFEFLLFNMLIISGKCKVLDKLGYIMQRSIIRSFDHSLLSDFMVSPSINEKWSLCGKEFSEIIRKKGVSEEESPIIAKGMFLLFLAHYHPIEPGWLSKRESPLVRKNLPKKLKYFVSHLPLLKSIYYKFYPPNCVDRPESKYFSDFKIVKDFLEKSR